MNENKVWFITGTSTGFGRIFAEKAAEHGYCVAATARRAEALDDLVDRFPERVKAFELDVTQPDQVAETVEAAFNAFGRIDVLVNNAGYPLVGALEEFNRDQMRRNFETNFWGTVSVTRAVLPIMRDQQSGHIFNISAIAGFFSEVGFSIYGASKAAVEAVSESLRQEVKPLGIRITLVEPGPFRTGFIGHSLAKASGHIPDYDPTSGAFAKLLHRIDGRQAGDPCKAADLIIRAAESDNPPFRLVLGRYAIKRARAKLTEVETDLKNWETLCADTDVDPTPKPRA